MAKYLLTGHVLDQQEAALVGKEVMLQRLYFPHKTTNGVVMGQELWFTTIAGGAVPAAFYLVPGIYRFECRVGAVRNVAYMAMPDEDAVLEDILTTVTEADAVIGRFETVAEAQANHKTYDLIWISETAINGAYGWFENKGDTATHDGENYIVDAEGVVYTYRP